jgi:hypothetical protein
MRALQAHEDQLALAALAEPESNWPALPGWFPNQNNRH